MSVTTKPILNQGQQEAADGFFQFLLGPEREMIISGPGGVGKTFLMGHMIDRVMPQYFETCKLMGIQPEYDEVVMTATTNKAAEVLSAATGRPTSTIHSFLGLMVRDDHLTGQSALRVTGKWKVHQRKIIFVDEAYLIDTPLLQFICEGTHGCKVVYVGDHCQLAPVMENVSPIHTAGLPFYGLTQPMRNADQPALMTVCQQLRNTVETGVFQPIQIVPGVVDWLNDDEMEQAIAQTFQRQTRASRILAYTNKRVVDFNNHIRNLRGLPHEYDVGEFLVNNQVVEQAKLMIRVEEDIEIVGRADTTRMIDIDEHGGNQIQLEVRDCMIKRQFGAVEQWPLPCDRDHFAQLVRYYQRKKDWTRYFNLKKKFPDLRQRDAATVHKAQGSTYDTVFIDLGDLSGCHNPATAARLLYVAFTRARNRVFLYGDLAQKYGGLIV